MRRLEELEEQVAHLESEKSDLLVRVAVLENERSSWMNRERELVHRVLSLESQLGESHRALLNVGHTLPSTSTATV
jgi:chromosome segregation ATPase